MTFFHLCKRTEGLLFLYWRPREFSDSYVYNQNSYVATPKLLCSGGALQKGISRATYSRMKINFLAKPIKKLFRQKPQTMTIDGFHLDPGQTAAVLANEDANLILAPAGSGKTATLLAKVEYLITHHKIKPENILLIAFTRKVVAELNDRIKNKDVEIRTFHSFGNKIIASEYKDTTLIDEDTERSLIHQIIQTLTTKNPKYKEAYETYLAGDLSESTTTFIETHTATDPEAFELLIISILDLQKSKRLNLKDLQTRLAQLPDSKEKQNSLSLLNLYAPIYQAYTHHLKSHHLYDFADMLNLSTEIIKNKPANSYNYQYILVDEAQDLSESKCELLKALLDKCDKARLFAVGDDWQSIYRFAGSNLGVLDGFEKTFKRTTYRGCIEYTYRFGQPTAKISNKFIIKNPRQSKKRVRPAIRHYTPIIVRLNPPANKTKKQTPPDYETINKELNDLYHEFGGELKDKSLQIISRYNRDIYRLVQPATNQYQNAKYDPETSTLYWRINLNPPRKKHKTHQAASKISPALTTALTLKLPFCSLHKAKGITRDIVFFINANSGSHGIPATRGDNLLMSTMLSRPDAYPYAEERRLFYVAITRAKDRTVIISDAKNISPFVLEIKPRIKKGKLD